MTITCTLSYICKICVQKGELHGKTGNITAGNINRGEWVVNASFTHSGSRYTYQSLSSCTYFCLSRESLLLVRLGRFAVDGME